MRLEEALYFLHDGKLLVNGTYMTEVHVAALVTGNTQCKWAYVSYFAGDLNGPCSTLLVALPTPSACSSRASPRQLQQLPAAAKHHLP